MAPPHEPADGHASTMRCMEIRGGCQSVEETMTVPGLDVYVFSHPHEGAEGGGDVHYLSLCGGGFTTRLAVADVSGHGASASGFGASLRDLMRRNINAKSPMRLLVALNREFAELAKLQRFATAVVATYRADDRKLTVCNAGHPRPLWYRAADGVWSVLDGRDARTSGVTAEPDDLPLGLDDATRYNPFSIRLSAGDLLLVYTDALIEAVDASGRMLGEDGLLDLARRVGPTPTQGGGLSVGPRLLDAVAAHRGGVAADDDVTLVVLAGNGQGPRRPSLGEKLDVYAKVFGLKGY